MEIRKLGETEKSRAENPALAAGSVCPNLRRIMYDLALSGAQKSFLRGLGQTLEPALKLGKGGATPAFYAELQKQLRAHELVKLRFLGVDRAERAALCAQIADEGRCLCVGAVGHTALFYRQQPEPSARRITLPE